MGMFRKVGAISFALSCPIVEGRTQLGTRARCEVCCLYICSSIKVVVTRRESALVRPTSKSVMMIHIELDRSQHVSLKILFASKRR
jgi:hypothetical protein